MQYNPIYAKIIKDTFYVGVYLWINKYVGKGPEGCVSFY